MSSHGSAAVVCKRWAAILKSTSFRTARRVGGFTEYGILVAGGTDGLRTPYAEGWLRVGERWRADEWDVEVYNESFRNRIKDERWWCVRGGEQSDLPDGRYYHLGDNMLHRVGRAADRRTRKAWKELPGCPPALHRISSPAVVTIELG